MLSFIIWLPIVAAFFLFLTPIKEVKLARFISVLTMLVVLLLSFYIFIQTSVSSPDYLFETRRTWVSDLGISYHLGVNRLSAILILLSTLVGAGSIIIAQVKHHARHFYALGLIMIGGMIGAFASLDLFFIYIFHEFALIPTFILIGLWGSEKKRVASMKITLYLGLGSIVLLLGLLGLYLKAGGNTFDLVTLKNRLIISPLAKEIQIYLFAILFLGFGILISVFPFHTWAPMGYGEAPSLASMIHSGVIKKFGLYGLMVIAVPLLPEGFQYWKPWIIWMTVGNLIYCGYVAMQQKDLRYMLAYSSVSHMGYALLALVAHTTVAIQGFTLFLFAHGLSSAAGFGIAGYSRDQTGTSWMSNLGGLARKTPFAASVFTMIALAGCGLPGFANFPAELMILLGSFHDYPRTTILAGWTVVISAVYMLRAVRRVFLGPPFAQEDSVHDVDGTRRKAFILLLAVLLLGGFWPHAILGKSPSTNLKTSTVSKPEIPKK